MINCNICGVELDETNKSNIKGLKQCTECYNKRCRSRAASLRFEKGYWGDEVRLYGAHQIKKNPGEFCDDQQREEVHSILKAIGWSYNEDNGVWYDGKIKNKDGEWLVDVESSSPGPATKYRRFVQDNNIKVPAVGYSRIPEEERPLNTEQILDIQNKFFFNNKTYHQLAKEYDTPIKNINWVILTTYRRLSAMYGKEL